MSGAWQDLGSLPEQLASGGFSTEFPWGDWDWISLALKDKVLAQLYMKESLRITDPQYLIDLK